MHSEEQGFLKQKQVEKMKKIRYIDQNNNSYTIEHGFVYYAPIRPEESSSGTYSGGEKAKKTIKQKTYESVVEKVNAIVENKSLHLTQRRMMTAMLYVYKEDNRDKYIIAKSKERTELEALLKTILKGEE